MQLTVLKRSCLEITATELLLLCHWNTWVLRTFKNKKNLYKIKMMTIENSLKAESLMILFLQKNQSWHIKLASKNDGPECIFPWWSCHLLKWINKININTFKHALASYVNTKAPYIFLFEEFWYKLWVQNFNTW